MNAAAPVSPILRIAAAVAVVFGLLTVFSGGMALFGGRDMGAVVPFVLWFNFLAGFAYVLAGLGLWRARPWSRLLAGAIVAMTVVVFAAFLLLVIRGGAYEMRTLGAMTLRTSVWGAFSLPRCRASVDSKTRKTGPARFARFRLNNRRLAGWGWQSPPAPCGPQ